MRSLTCWVLIVTTLSLVCTVHSECTEATSPAGAVVTYATPTPTPPIVILSCLPSSGSVFPVGSTTVTCEGIDEEGNAVPGPSFVIEVCLVDYINDCATANGGCSELATCISTGNNTHTCTCPPGYYGDGVTCTLINECASSPCLNGGVCQDQVDAYFCNCTNTGYAGETCQTDINECNSTVTMCSLPLYCVNIPGGFNCTACSPGYTFNAQSRACELCEVGRFWNSSSLFCQACPPGKFQNQQGALYCQACNAGAYAGFTSATSCLLCDYNQYSNQTGSSACFNCTQGLVAPDRGLTRCFEPCGQGRVWNSSSLRCDACLPGTYQNDAQCEQCGLGTFSGIPAATSCMTCDYNQYSNQTGMTACFNCTNGQIAPARGSTQCITPPPQSSSSSGTGHNANVTHISSGTGHNTNATHSSSGAGHSANFTHISSTGHVHSKAASANDFRGCNLYAGPLASVLLYILSCW